MTAVGITDGSDANTPDLNNAERRAYDPSKLGQHLLHPPVNKKPAPGQRPVLAAQYYKPEVSGDDTYVNASTANRTFDTGTADNDLYVNDPVTQQLPHTHDAGENYLGLTPATFNKNSHQYDVLEGELARNTYVNVRGGQPQQSDSDIYSNVP